MCVYVENGRGQGTVDTLPLPFFVKLYLLEVQKNPSPRPATRHTS